MQISDFGLVWTRRGRGMERKAVERSGKADVNAESNTSLLVSSKARMLGDFFPSSFRLRGKKKSTEEQGKGIKEDDKLASSSYRWVMKGEVEVPNIHLGSSHPLLEAHIFFSEITQSVRKIYRKHFRF